MVTGGAERHLGLGWLFLRGGFLGFRMSPGVEAFSFRAPQYTERDAQVGNESAVSFQLNNAMCLFNHARCIYVICITYFIPLFSRISSLTAPLAYHFTLDIKGAHLFLTIVGSYGKQMQQFCSRCSPAFYTRNTFYFLFLFEKPQTYKQNKNKKATNTATRPAPDPDPHYVLIVHSIKHRHFQNHIPHSSLKTDRNVPK